MQAAWLEQQASITCTGPSAGASSWPLCFSQLLLPGPPIVRWHLQQHALVDQAAREELKSDTTGRSEAVVRDLMCA